MNPFFVYILHCADGSYYVGHTDDLERRFSQHVSGECGGYTSNRRPIELVYIEKMGERIDALERERKLKGWSRAKKEQLIAGTLKRGGVALVTGERVSFVMPSL